MKLRRSAVRLAFGAVTAGSLSVLLLLAVPGTSRADILYVANYGSDTIEEFCSSGVSTLFASVPSGTSLSEPVALAFDSVGNLYVGYANEDGTIEKYNQSGGVLSSNGTVFASAGPDGSFGLAFDNAGNLYAANYFDDTIEKINSSGAGKLFANSGLVGPSGMAFDSAGNLYVANYDNNTIEKFNSSGVGTVFASSGVDGPFGMAFDSAGDLYVSNVGNNTIVEFNSSGGVLSSNATVFANTELDAPLGLAFDSGGNLYVPNFYNNTIVEFNSSGGVLSSNATVFANAGLDQPYALALRSVGACTYTINSSCSPAGGGTTGGGGTVNCGSNMVCATPSPCHSFVSWTDQNSNVVSTSACYSFSLTNSETLVANFTPVSCVINTTSSPSAGGSTTGGGTVACGSNRTVCATVNPCHSFVNWTDQSSNVLSAAACYTFIVTTNETLAANFVLAPTNYTITTVSSPAAGGSISGGGTVACASSVTVCAAANPCYSFVNWTDQNSNLLSTTTCYTFTPNSSTNLTANFTQTTCSISTSSSPPAGGSTSGGGTVACGSNATVCAVANACYGFVNWTDQNTNVISTSPCYTFTAATNETLVANFAPIVSYTINTGSLPSAGGSTIGGGTVACGSNVTVCATPNAPCYSFNLWTDQNGLVVSRSLCYTFTPNADSDLTARFVVLSSYAISTTNISGGGSTTGGGDVACGSNVTVCAVPISCYNFVSWADENSNVVSTSACYSFAAEANETLVASFTPILPGGSTNSTLTNLWSFSGSLDGSYPFAVLVQGSDSNFYGTTSSGGASGNGTVFRISPGGSLTNLWEFTGGSDGASPYAGLVQGSNGNFYGTTSGSGSGPSGNGTVFRISPSGSLTNLWEFTGGGDGASPFFSSLTQGGDGNFYGTTSSGGASGDGTVFRISPGGSLTNLWEFTGGSDGASPYAGLAQGSDGNFYGTTSGGGASGNGTVFRISRSGSLTNLWEFTGGSDGASPYAGLLQGSDGNFYGTTSGGGANNNGTVFRISPNGSLTNLWEFNGCSDGASPYAGLVQGSDGNFYGTTSSGGANNNGTMFRISPSGSLTIPWGFTNGLDGANSYAPLLQGIDGNFYGTTSGSGSGLSAKGTVFKLTTPLTSPPYPINQITSAQFAAPNIILTVSSIAGETYQLQYRNSLTSGSWSNVPGVSMTNSIGALLTLTNFGGAVGPQGFYRFAITP